MDIKDLMVGDLVSVSGKSVKITKDDLATMLIFLDDDSKINPIPLTEEILVKNGFEKRYFDYDFSYDLYEDDNVSFIRLYDHGEGVFFTETSGGDIVINYVHQLQRLLRLCNIDKEIIL